MKIGLTYDLRSEYLAQGYSEEETLEFDREETIDAIDSTLRQLGHQTERIGNARQLIAALLEGKKWDLVFNIAEGLRGIGREAQIPAILDLYEIPYTFSDPLVMSLTLHKGMTKHVVRDAGIATTDFLVADSADDARTVPFSPPFFIKPLAEGTGKGITPDSIITRQEDLPGAVALLLERFRQPVLIEPYLTGREFTVGILGTGKDARTIGTIEVLLLENAEQGVYSCTNKEEWEERVEYRLVHPENDEVVKAAEATALKAWRVLGCRDAGRLDLRCDSQGIPQFMEVNPLAGIHPEHSDLPIICNKLGIPYATLIDGIVRSAAKRL